ncbi:MAG: hypothetical protein NT120_04385 [Candidatus Aenigmarchaeota archaeon]|nr:hypothetical protein [Candidatus Aenigmarchaeota archaeon]
MEKKYVAVLIIIILALLFLSGFFLSSQTIDVGGCTAEWKTTTTTVAKSELCSLATCAASPADQQHNAIVSAILCACDKTKTANYANDANNKRIEDVVKQYFGYTTTAQELCDQPGMILVRRSYG